MTRPLNAFRPDEWPAEQLQSEPEQRSIFKAVVDWMRAVVRFLRETMR